jgi:hypothetical protein
MKPISFRIGVVLTIALGAAPARAQSPLPTTVMTGTTSRSMAATYTFAAPAPGLLAVVVRGTTGDLRLAVTDSEGQVLTESDSDLGGNTSAEQLTLQIGVAGNYMLTIDTDETRSEFKVGSTFLPFPELASAPDPDGTPARARAIDVNKSFEDALATTKNDLRDWFVVTAPSAGVLTVVTRGVETGSRSAFSSGDLLLESFRAPDFREAVERSDRDNQGNAANESVTIDAKAGERVYFRLSAGWLGSPNTPYRLTVSFIPD